MFWYLHDFILDAFTIILMMHSLFYSWYFHYSCLAISALHFVNIACIACSCWPIYLHDSRFLASNIDMWRRRGIYKIIKTKRNGKRKRKWGTKCERIFFLLYCSGCMCHFSIFFLSFLSRLLSSLMSCSLTCYSIFSFFLFLRVFVKSKT